MIDKPIVRKSGKKEFVWDKKAFGGKGAWYEVHRKGGFGRLANTKEKKQLGNPNAPVENKESEEPSVQRTELGISRSSARSVRNIGLKELIIDKLLQGHGTTSLPMALSESLEAHAMGLMEMFDPLSIAKRFTGSLGATIIGLATGRSDKDLEYFIGSKRKKFKNSMGK